ncbi:MAG TPA: DUF885 domain-containing protein [Opitutus sp.]|nr:DUF885 domain-containing protein [Opitutus sp.]
MSSRVRLAHAFSLLLAAASFVFAADEPAWIVKSNENARLLVDVIASQSPETATRLGATGYDEQIADLAPGSDARRRERYTSARDELVRRARVEGDPRVHEDLEILIKAANDQLESDALSERLLLPYVDVARLIFYGESGLLDDQVAANRRPAALARLRRYAGLEPGTQPITVLAEERYRERTADPARLAPFKGEVEKSLASLPRYAAGIRQLYARFGIDHLDGAGAALDLLDHQLQAHADWVRANVLAHARADFRLPPELYADNLKNIGLDISPEELIAKAQVAFAEIRNEMQAVAVLVAQEHGFADTDYRAVIHALKKDQLTPADVEPYYHGVIAQLQDLIRREKIVTLPERPLRMRLASAAETAAQPAPHFQPPPLIDGHGEQGVFILTTGNPAGSGDAAASDTYDDFTFKAAAWTLTAHEGRPGHDLQFAAMAERGISQARSIFAFNSVNVEGWALYAEAEMRPYEPLDGQLIALQLRLLRAARAILDPMLNLGRITPERAHEILTHDVCLSDAFARSEVERYTFNAPGQATAYFYGYTRLMELRTQTELSLGAKFDHQAFNDFILDQGLLPPALLAKAVREEFIPAQMQKAG